ncbi:MAG: AAA family ATPase, partial [Chloroflexota bacterium]
MTIRNVAVIRETRIEFGETMTAITGETGAGKSIVLDALGAVLGERTSADIVRSGTERAYVEAIFDVDHNATRDRILSILEDNGIEHDPGEPLILSRDIVAEGRSTARINGRAVTAGTLTEVGEHLVDIHGQSEHLSLLRTASQRDLLDRFAGAIPLRRELAERYREWRSLRRRIESFESERRDRAQRLDLLRFQIEEIDGVAPKEGEDEQLESELSILS